MSSTHQQWDIVSGIGLTALAVAAARGLESQRQDRLINDPYAAAFVGAANPPVPLPTTLAATDLNLDSDPDPALDIWAGSAGYMALRSRFLDDYFAANPTSQVVILAAGLDARAYRVAWPAGCALYEVDQPKVLEFKQQVLDELGAAPACDRRPVPADLRDDWVAALREAGFDPAKPTAWLAEGLLPYLPAKAEEGLFELVHELSAPGSVICVEHANHEDMRAMLSSPMAKQASERFGIDVGALISTEPRRDCADWLRRAGWRVTLDRIQELATRYDRALPAGLAHMFGGVVMVTAHLGATSG